MDSLRLSFGIRFPSGYRRTKTPAGSLRYGDFGGVAGITAWGGTSKEPAGTPAVRGLARFVVIRRQATNAASLGRKVGGLKHPPLRRAYDGGTLCGDGFCF